MNYNKQRNKQFAENIRSYLNIHNNNHTNSDSVSFYKLLIELIYISICNLQFYLNIIWDSTDVFVVLQFVLCFMLSYFYGQHHWGTGYRV